MIIRQATISDIPNIISLLKEEDLQLADGSYFGEGIKCYLGDLFLVAEINNKIVGTVFGETIIEGAILWEIAVNPNYRNQGIGELLLTAFEETTIKNNADFILLYSSTKENIYNFYKKRGYTGNHKFIEMKKIIKEEIQ